MKGEKDLGIGGENNTAEGEGGLFLFIYLKKNNTQDNLKRKKIKYTFKAA